MRLLTIKFIGNVILASLVLSGCADLTVAKKAYEQENYELAQENYQELAKRGFPEAYKGMGNLTLHNNLQEKQTSLDYYIKAYNSGYKNAAIDISDELVTMQREKEAYLWLTKLQESENYLVKYKLAKMHINGIGTDQNIDRGLKELNELANNNYHPAHVYLGDTYHKGVYVSFSDEDALMHYEKAYLLGNEYAKLKAADIYAQNNSSLYNRIKAQKLYEEYARLGNGYASYKIAKLYSDTVEKAVPWYKKSAIQNYPQGILMYALLELEGKYIIQDRENAIKTIELLSQNGFNNASYELGKIYFNGTYVNKNDAKALKYFSLAKIQGYEMATIAIANVYAQYNASIRDDIKAENIYTENLHFDETRYFLGKFYEQRGFINKATKQYEMTEISNLHAKFSIAKLELKAKTSLDSITKLAGLGYTPATLYLANIYKDLHPNLSLKLYELAVKQGDKNAKLKIADMLSDKESSLYNPSEAQSIYLSYANRHHTSGMQKLANFLEQQQNTITNISYTWYAKAAEAGSLHSKLRIADMKRDGEYLDYNIQSAINDYKSLVNYPYAKVNLGDIYLEGYGVEFNAKLAIFYYEEAYSLGLDEAELRIADILYNGYGVEIDPNKAKVIYEKHALNNNKKASYALASIYEKEKNREKALYWYEKSAQDGYVAAEYRWALMIKESNPKMSNILLKSASDKGYAKAQVLYGKYMFYSKGEEKGLQTVFKAVQNGDTEAITTALELISNIKDLDNVISAYKKSTQPSKK